MKAYTQGISKAEFVAEMKKHQAADAFIRGTYQNDSKDYFQGCSVGCALESVSNLKNIQLDHQNHKEFETHLGVPEWLAYLNDALFENIPKVRAKVWPVEFAEAVNEGSNLDLIKVPFIVYILNENLKTLDSLKVDVEHKDIIAVIEQAKDATKQMIIAQESGNQVLIEAARSAADSAAESSESVARSVAWSARSAAWSAELVARSVARSSESVARSVAWLAAESARVVAYNRHADKLLELIKECK